MRLLDQVMQCRSDVEVTLPGTGLFRIPGAAIRADALARTPIRYVLGNDVRSLCEQIWRQWPSMLDPSDDRFRLPVEQMWIEWEAPGCAIVRHTVRQRFGILVTATQSGRSGKIESFWDDSAFGVDRAQVIIEFDFDRRFADFDRRCSSFPLTGARQYPFFQHARAVVDPAWQDYFSFTRMPAGGLAEVVELCMKRTWTDLPMMMAFLRLIAVRSAIQLSPTNLIKLNHARKKRNKSPLLDHIEVSATIGASPKQVLHRDNEFQRPAPRLHRVRGHLVQRGGTLFWRQAHLRGRCDTRPIKSRTISVSLSNESVFDAAPIQG